MSPLRPASNFRKWRQFRLRTLLAAMLVLGPLLGWGGPKAVQSFREWRNAVSAEKPAPRDLRWATYYHINATSSAGGEWEYASSFPESEPPSAR